MSSSNLRDHCAFALTVLLSENGAKAGGTRRSACAGEDEDEDEDGSLTSRALVGSGRGGAPVCHRVPTLVIPTGEGRGLQGPRVQLSILTGASSPLCQLLLPFWLHPWGRGG